MKIAEYFKKNAVFLPLMPFNKNDSLVQILKKNWLNEKKTARTYRDLAEIEKNPRKKEILLKLAQTEEQHALRWEKELAALGQSCSEKTSRFKRILEKWLNQNLGFKNVIQRMERTEEQDKVRYLQQKALFKESAEIVQLLEEMAKEEKSHAGILHNLPRETPFTENITENILAREKWHGRGGNWITDSIYGINDGLGAVFGIVSGVAGATENQTHYILISGLAGMIASSLSMGAGAYLAAKSQKEVYEAEISKEKREIEENPQEEIEEMALFYQLQGFNEEEAKWISEKLYQKPEHFLSAMVSSELGLSHASFPNPWRACLSASLSTALGAFIPLTPFFFLSGIWAISLSFFISLVAHFLVGAAKTLITGRSWLSSGLEMTVVGIIEAVVTYTLGLLFRLPA
ncbi:VIT1/CCC1 transporter family protein [Candidatus Methylacidiphilum infernorum]|uniref:VIT1/CCC1 transporter family protein n=2 Tax=Candidatus Methylacidiphilum infernorum TaxID=511746 RepID=A0ABX7PXX7_9BACT|nr:VIT1/CCC1 transporter family protein [Candidatus Methylacidiphilum infernorum]